MKKLLFGFVIVTAIFSFALVGFNTIPAQAQVATCPAGYTCNPLPECPVGYVCQPAPQPVGCPVGYICNVTPSGGDGNPVISCYIFTQDLSIGSTGPDVVALQTWLIGNGYDIPAISSGKQSKGYFGNQTLVALNKYQNRVGIHEDYFGPLTRAKLNASCADSTKPSITVLSPNRGEVFKIGQQMNVRWNTGAGSGTEYVSLILRKTDTGDNFPPDSGNQAVRVINNGSYRWTIGNISIGQYILRIICEPVSGCPIADSQIFTITSSSTTSYLQVSNTSAVLGPVDTNSSGVVTSRSAGFQFTLTAENSTVYLGKAITDTAFLDKNASVVFGAKGYLVPSKGGLGAVPNTLAGDTPTYYVIPAGSSRQFIVSVSYDGSNCPSGYSCSNIVSQISGINYGTSPTNLSAYSISSGLENLKVVLSFDNGGGSTQQPSITISSPTAGGGWQPGDRMTVKWSTQNIASGANLDVIRLRNMDTGWQEYNLASNTQNDGSETVTIPSVPNGTYTLEIKSSVKGFTNAVTGSSGKFTINSFGATTPPTISPLTVSCSATPATAYTGPTGESATIQWSANPNGGTSSSGTKFEWSIYNDGVLANGQNGTNYPGITVTYASGGTKQAVVRVTDSTSSATAACSATVVKTTPVTTTVAPTLNPSSLNKNIQVGQSINQVFVVENIPTGKNGSWNSWSVAKGDLPPGVSLNQYGAFSGSLSGTPTTAGTYNFMIQGYDTADNLSAYTWVYLTVTPTPTPTAAPTAYFTVEGQHSYTYTVGQNTHYKWAATNADTFSSTYTANNPTQCGAGTWAASTANGTIGSYLDSSYAGCVWTVTYTAKNSQTGQSASDTVTVTVNPPVAPPTTNPTNAPSTQNVTSAIWDAIREYYDRQSAR